MSPADHQLSPTELQRVARQTLLPGFGLEQQQALHRTHVFVIGAGGLGCPLMQQLAAAGVGEITVIDDDTVDITNIHRQILFGVDDVGRPKVEVVTDRLRQLQPDIVVHPVRDRLTADNALDYLQGVDILVDGSDTFSTKFLAADAAEVTGIPLVWGSVLRFRGDCALWWSGPGADSAVGMRDLYPEQPDPDSVPDCATAGVLGVTTSVVAGLMATELIQFASGMNKSRAGLLSIYDALSASISHFRVRHDAARTHATALQPSYDYAGCAAPRDSGDSPSAADRMLDDLRNGGVAIDVREGGEKILDDFFFDATTEHYHLPTSMWQGDPGMVESLFDSLTGDQERTVWVYCASGKRSGAFVESFSSAASARSIVLRNLPGGIGKQPTVTHGLPGASGLPKLLASPRASHPPET